jgi:hypothetical protein
MVYLDLSQDTEKPYRWGMQYSFCKSKGPIVRFVEELVNQIDPSKKIIIPACDGIAHADDNEQLPIPPTWRLDYAYKNQVQPLLELEEQNPDIVGVLCTRNHTNPKYVYLPLDDDTFLYGIQGIPTIPWEQKRPVAFWRGGTSGHPFVRKALVERVVSNPNFDVKFVGHYGTREVPDHYFSDFVGIEEQVRNKYIFVVDGAVISSAHQWVFGSGSVPILVTHPTNNFWFKSHLKPWVNYIPVSYSLTELEPTIQWLQEHDQEARQIAENARELARTIFSPGYQQSYVTKAVEHALGL